VEKLTLGKGRNALWFIQEERGKDECREVKWKILEEDIWEFLSDGLSFPLRYRLCVLWMKGEQER
jgi:hypothetical protein